VHLCDLVYAMREYGTFGESEVVLCVLCGMCGARFRAGTGKLGACVLCSASALCSASI